MPGFPKNVDKIIVCRYVTHIVLTKCTIRECAKYYTTEHHKVHPGTVYVYASKYFKNLYPDHPYNRILREIWRYNKRHHRRSGSI